MTSKILLALLVQSLILLPRAGPDEPGEATDQHMREREELLSQETSRLLQELEQESQRSSAWGALPFAASQLCQILDIAGLLHILFGLCWWLWKRCLRRRSHVPESSRVESCRNKVDSGEQKETTDFDLHLCRAFWTLDQPALISMVEKVVRKLLCICHKFSKTGFVPVVQPGIARSCKFESWSSDENYVVYHVLVPLKAPHGHSFHLELGTTGEVPSKGSRICVELECTCMRDQLKKDMLCFLHHPKEELSRIQSPSLLDTLCIGSYLDLVKTARWFQILVSSAWVALPESKDCRLTVLPSSRSCKLRLTCALSIPVLIEMTLGVEVDDSDTIHFE